MSDFDFEFILSSLKVRAKGIRAVNRAFILISMVIVLVAAPIAGGLAWAIAHGDWPVVSALTRLASAWK